MLKKMMMVVLGVCVVGVVAASPGWGVINLPSVPTTINFQGKLTPVPADGTIITFSLIVHTDFPKSDTSIWGESWTIGTGSGYIRPDSKGVFSVDLGSKTPLPIRDKLMLQTYQTIKMRVDVGPVLIALQPLSSVPYALVAERAISADYFGGLSTREVINAATKEVAAQGLGGASQWQPATGGIAYNAGNVGIGVVSPAAKLQVINDGNIYAYAVSGSSTQHPSGVGVQGYSEYGSGGSFGSKSGYDITCNGPKSYFKGNVGFGTADPGDWKLMAYKDDDNYAGIVAGGSGALIRGADFAVRANSTDGYGIHSNAPKSYFSGNVGIGSLTPEASLHIKSASPLIKLSPTSSSGGAIQLFGSGGQLWGVAAGPDDSNFNIFYYKYPMLKEQKTLVVKSNGSIGIGTSEPVATLQVQSNSHPSLKLASNSKDTGSYIELGTTYFQGQKWQLWAGCGGEPANQNTNLRFIDTLFGRERMTITTNGVAIGEIDTGVVPTIKTYRKTGTFGGTEIEAVMSESRLYAKKILLMSGVYTDFPTYYEKQAEIKSADDNATHVRKIYVRRGTADQPEPYTVFIIYEE